MKWISITTLLLFLPYITFAQDNGCTDSKAKNFNPEAIYNDGSCIYTKTKIKPIFTTTISDSINETSGLIYWINKLWTINDDSDTNLYSLDTTGNTFMSLSLQKVKNKDWEAISQDSTHLYIGDFGNNVSGNRKDLHIFKIEKSGLLQNKIQIDTIAFSFEKQNNFEKQSANKTDFDCETMLVTRDSLYLLTKEWKSIKTSLYVLPKAPGNYQAKFKSSFNVKGLITGGVILEDKKVIVLCGYSKMLQPFLYLLYDYDENDFFSANKRKIKLDLPFHQVEGIASKDGINFYITNEKFERKPFISVNQSLHLLNLSSYLTERD